MLPDSCPICEWPMTQQDIHRGFIYCRAGHVITIAPIQTVDPRLLRELASGLATRAAAPGEDVDAQAIARWRALL